MKAQHDLGKEACRLKHGNLIGVFVESMLNPSREKEIQAMITEYQSIPIDSHLDTTATKVEVPDAVRTVIFSREYLRKSQKSSSLVKKKYLFEPRLVLFWAAQFSESSQLRSWKARVSCCCCFLLFVFFDVDRVIY